MEIKSLDIKNNLFKLLNGMSLGIILSLIPEGVFGELAKALHLGKISPVLSLSTTLMCFVIGICIASEFKLDTISSFALAISTFIAGGSFKGFGPNGLIIKGAGDIINCSIGAIVALLVILSLKDRLKAYKLLILPAVTVMITTLITSFTAAPVSEITLFIGNIIDSFTKLQPYLMSILIALSFSILIVSPLSTVGIALLINLKMNGSAAANIGVLSMALTLGILSYRSNGLGTAIAHFMGSPKIQMANFIRNPKIVIPGMVTALFSSILVPIFNIQGTPMSAGFGLSGLIGPLGHLNSVGFSLHNIEIAGLVFIVIPVILAFISSYIFKNKFHLVTDENFKI